MDPSPSSYFCSSGSWIFCNRRWLDPSHPQDRVRLDAGYDALCAAFPAFAACPRAAFLARLAHVSFSAARRRALRAAASQPGLADLSFRPPPPLSPPHNAAAAVARGGGGGCDDACRSPAAAAVRIPRLLNPLVESAGPSR